jgi:hypothetical protein
MQKAMLATLNDVCLLYTVIMGSFTFALLELFPSMAEFTATNALFF